ncbi:helix-turn-helix domain-containing protein [Nocardia mexicana]|uniref:Helix-turn-helix protein n=1 Tax=Nocardia mexicana TaxID=279262 RepID=A0A370H4P8_9NOCA|nr:helix-turn-helix transcriptional regulator [Nocardia mexicana]RDI51153.1 helix-turn-helix protein [Nocardia mexicana]
MSEIGSTLARRALGRELRRMRTANGLTLAEAGRAAETSPQSISRTEDGMSTRVTRLQMNALCDLFGATDAERRMMIGLVDEVRKAQKNKGGWRRGYADEIHYDFDHYLGLEDAANRITAWNVTSLLGLLQTPAYRRALAWAESPSAPPEQIEKRIEWATRRQALLLEDKRLDVDVIMSEAVIRNQIGGPVVMADQLQHLLNMLELPNISLRIVGFDEPSPLGLLSGSFILLEFPPLPQSKLTEPPVVYVEEYAGDLFLEQEADVQRYRNALRDITRVALSKDQTRQLILDVAEEYPA